MNQPEHKPVIFLAFANDLENGGQCAVRFKCSTCFRFAS
jgi:hypothetical protein